MVNDLQNGVDPIWPARCLFLPAKRAKRKMRMLRCNHDISSHFYGVGPPEIHPLEKVVYGEVVFLIEQTYAGAIVSGIQDEDWLVMTRHGLREVVVSRRQDTFPRWVAL